MVADKKWDDLSISLKYLYQWSSFLRLICTHIYEGNCFGEGDREGVGLVSSHRNQITAPSDRKLPPWK